MKAARTATRAWAAAGLLALCTPLAAQRLQILEAIPAAFHGEWAVDLRNCGTGDNDDRLLVGARHWQTYESMGQLRAAVAAGRREVALVLDSEGEGEHWQETVHLRLDWRGRLHLIGAAHAPLRRRCPAQESK